MFFSPSTQLKDANDGEPVRFRSSLHAYLDRIVALQRCYGHVVHGAAAANGKNASPMDEAWGDWWRRWSRSVRKAEKLVHFLHVVVIGIS